MVDKVKTSLSEVNKEHPKFATSMVEIMDIISHSGGINEVIKKREEKRKFKSGEITFSEMNNKKDKNKKTVAD